MPLLIGLHALKQEVIDRMPLRMVGGGWALDGGGNARGVKAVDLQTKRSAVTQVASGDYSAVLGGYYNTASGIRSVVINGIANNASGQDSTILGGNSNKVDGVSSVVLGGGSNYIYGDASIIGEGQYNQITIAGGGSFIGAGNNNVISNQNGMIGAGSNNNISGEMCFIGSGDFNTVSGNYGSVLSATQAKVDKWGQTTKSSFMFTAQGDAQGSQLTAGCKTTNNTPEELFLDGDAGAVRCTIASDTTWAFHILVVARRTDADNESAAYDFVGCIDNNAGTTALVGSVTKTIVAEDTSAWDCNVTADNTNDALIITATGENSKTIQWVAFIQLVETTG
jgi:hypothetical protein